MSKNVITISNKIFIPVFSLYVLLSAVVPCPVLDDCAETMTAGQSSGAGKQQDCNDCSPFSFCSQAHVFTFTNHPATIEPAIFIIQASYNEFHITSCSGYHSCLFQPPRIV